MVKWEIDVHTIIILANKITPKQNSKAYLTEPDTLRLRLKRVLKPTFVSEISYSLKTILGYFKISFYFLRTHKYKCSSKGQYIKLL